jgi:archaellum biogenesis ATPase FlaH
MDTDMIRDSVAGGQTALVLVNSDNFREAADQLTADLLDRGQAGIFFTADRQFDEVLADLEYRGADCSELQFLDIVSKSRGIQVEDECVRMVTSPTAFNDILLELNEQLDAMEEGDFVVLDSFTSYLLYGDVVDIGNFVKRISDELKDRDTTLYVFAMEQQIDDEIVEKCMTFCDEKIDLS